MRMLVKRDTTTKSGLFGSKQLFQMTLKVELTPEEQATVERYGLQDSFSIAHPSDSDDSFSYREFMAGKTITNGSVKSLLVNLDLYKTVLEVANDHIKNHMLFPGESIIEIA